MPQETTTNGKRPALNVLAAIGREAWAMTPSALENMLAVASRQTDIDAVMRREGGELEGASWRTQVRDGVAVVPVRGPIFRHANIMTALCGATSVASLAKDIAAAVDNPDVVGIVLDIDSPGGQVTGTNELAQQIFDARSSKPVVAYAGGMMASAAYWIGSAAGEIVAERTAEIGSIGVVAAYTDASKREEKEGVKSLEIVSSQSPKKRLPPTTEQGRAEVQKMVDGLADVFVETVARNRGASTEKVLEDFGQGGMMLASEAIAAGMADRVGTLEGVISELAQRAQAQNAGGMPAYIMPVKRGAGAETETAEKNAEDIMDIGTLKAEHPELYSQVLAEGKAAGVSEERARMQAIDEIAKPGHEQLVREAKFGEKPMTAEGLAVAMIRAEKSAGDKFIAQREEDAKGAIVPSGDTEGAPKANDETERSALVDVAVAAVNARRKPA